MIPTDLPVVEYGGVFEGAHQQEGLAAICDFDWPALLRALGEADVEERDLGDVARGLNVLLDWVAVGRGGKLRPLHVVGQRSVVLLWLLRPGSLNRVSLRQLAGTLGCAPARLAQISSEFTRAFGVKFAAQSRGDGVRRPPTTKDRLITDAARRRAAPGKWDATA